MKAEVLMPLIAPWMKQGDQFFADIESCYIWAFVPITECTAIGQIAQGRPASMLFADDMIDLATPKAVVLMDQAILTAP
jgi:hypothetical protein